PAGHRIEGAVRTPRGAPHLPGGADVGDELGQVDALGGREARIPELDALGLSAGDSDAAVRTRGDELGHGDPRVDSRRAPGAQVRRLEPAFLTPSDEHTAPTIECDPHRVLRAALEGRDTVTGARIPQLCAGPFDRDGEVRAVLGVCDGTRSAGRTFSTGDGEQSPSSTDHRRTVPSVLRE